VRSVTDERVAELEEFARLAGERESPLYERESAEPHVKRFRAIEREAEMAVLALDADTGHLVWRKDGADTAGLRTLSLCANGDRVFYQNGKGVVSLDLGTGEELWSVPSSRLRLVYDNSVICVSGQTATALSAFVANGSLWLGGFKPIEGKRGPAWGPYFVTQRDLATGEMLKHIEPENPGHHHRCYLNKATDRYILAGRRGTEFIDLESGDVLWHSWARGVCKYGIMPCNGLLYTPPHACACYVAAKLTGFSALASGNAKAAATSDEAPKLERGPAYDSPLSASGSPSSDDWPTYRYDAGRSGCTPTPVPAALRCTWRAEVGGKLTSPTVADGRVFVASVEEHRVCAIGADSGQPIWRFTAGARVDSPPTLQQDRAIFGCHDGYVYSVRASDGALAWRLRAPREERRIAARGQLESAWPVHGSVLVHDGVAYFTAGRSSYLDGGIELCRLEPRTGNTLSRTRIYSPDPETGRQPKQFAPSAMPGARADILAADGSHVYLRDMVFDKHGYNQPEGTPHLFTLTDFLDDSWPHRSYWVFGTRCSISTGCSGRDKHLIYGRLLVFDESTIYGYGRGNVHWSNQLQDGAYRVFAVKRGERTAQWEQPVPLQVRAMVLAGDVLFVAGPAADASEGPWVRDESQAAVLMAISASDGTVLAQCPLDGSPVFDGMAAARGRLYISLENGHLVCMAEQETTEG
jgi:outer membrane protein assembly factor BamB